MPKNLPKSLNKYLSKIKNKPNSPILNPLNSFTLSKKWIKSSCKHVKTLSFAVDGDQNDRRRTQSDDAATLSDVDRFLFENFQSLYFQNEENSQSSDETETLDCNRNRNRNRNRNVFEAPRFMKPPSDLRNAGPNLCFVGGGFEEGESSLSGTPSSAASNDLKIPDDCIAVLRYSASPCDDFRRSMREMVESRLLENGRVDWDFMEEIFFCYLNLNEKKSHRFILSAFVDLIVVLRHNSEQTPAKSPVPVSKRERKKMPNFC